MRGGNPNPTENNHRKQGALSAYGVKYITLFFHSNIYAWKYQAAHSVSKNYRDRQLLKYLRKKTFCAGRIRVNSDTNSSICWIHHILIVTG